MQLLHLHWPELVGIVWWTENHLQVWLQVNCCTYAIMWVLPQKETHGFNVKSVSPAYIAHFLTQDFSNILHVFLVGVLLFTPYSRSVLRTAEV